MTTIKACFATQKIKQGTRIISERPLKMCMRWISVANRPFSPWFSSFHEMNSKSSFAKRHVVLSLSRARFERVHSPHNHSPQELTTHERSPPRSTTEPIEISVTSLCSPCSSSSSDTSLEFGTRQVGTQMKPPYPSLTDVLVCQQQNDCPRSRLDYLAHCGKHCEHPQKRTMTL